MAVFAISFRIGDQGDRQSRWASVVEKIKEEATGLTWEETTSFFIIESPKSAEAVANAIYFNSTMQTDWDKLLVINLSATEHFTKGKIDYPALLELLMVGRYILLVNIYWHASHASDETDKARSHLLPFAHPAS